VKESVPEEHRRGGGGTGKALSSFLAGDLISDEFMLFPQSDSHESFLSKLSQKMDSGRKDEAFRLIKTGMPRLAGGTFPLESRLFFS